MHIKIDQTKPLYATSDPHYAHRNIIKYTNRKFSNIDEMNSELIRRWNNKVSKDATVIHLGDFCFGNSNQFKDFHNQLNGNFIWVFGNHDKPMPKEYIRYDVVEFEYNGIYFFCSHYAHKVWNHSHRGSIHLYGHSHGTLPDDINSLSMDVGIDCHENNEPFSFEEIMDKMKLKKFVAVDHHGKE